MEMNAVWAAVRRHVDEARAIAGDEHIGVGLTEEPPTGNVYTKLVRVSLLSSAILAEAQRQDRRCVSMAAPSDTHPEGGPMSEVRRIAKIAQALYSAHTWLSGYYEALVAEARAVEEGEARSS